MRRRAATVVVASLALVALASPSSAAAFSIGEKDSLESRVVARVNAVRKNHGLRPLKPARRLATAADRHATSMASASYFRHEFYKPTRATSWLPFGTWIRWFWPGPGYSTWRAGENLAWDAHSLGARRIVARWLGSRRHRANVLDRRWRSIGVAAVRVSGPRGYYNAWNDVTIVAAEFGTRTRR